MKSIKIDTIQSPAKSFRDEERETLVDQLTIVARDGFGTPITRDDVERHAFDGDFMHLLYYNGRVVGFSNYRREELPQGKVLFFNGTVIERASQQSGLYRLARTLALQEEKPDFIALRTQNPVVYGVAKGLVKRMYPDVDGAPKDVIAIARHFGGLTLEEDTFVLRGFYGTSLYDKIPNYPGVRAFFDNTLKMDYNRGDAVIAVGRVK